MMKYVNYAAMIGGILYLAEAMELFSIRGMFSKKDK